MSEEEIDENKIVWTLGAAFTIAYTALLFPLRIMKATYKFTRKRIRIRKMLKNAETPAEKRKLEIELAGLNSDEVKALKKLEDRKKELKEKAKEAKEGLSAKDKLKFDKKMLRAEKKLKKAEDEFEREKIRSRLKSGPEYTVRRDG